MTINNRFVYFEKKSDFDRQKSNISEYSIVFIKDPAMIWTHNTWYYCTPCPKKDSDINWFYNNEACDTLSIDILSNQEIILRNPHNLSPIEIETSGENDIVEIVNNVIRLPQNINTRKSGTVTVTATFAGNDEYKPSTIQCIINVQKKQYTSFGYNRSSDTIIIGQEQSHIFPILTNDKNFQNIVYSSSDNTVATINSTTGDIGVIGIGTTTITAVFGGNNIYERAEASYTLEVQQYVSAIPNYYIGWATGSNADYDVIEAMNGASLAALSDGYNTATTPSKTKTIVENDLVGDFQILFVMWKISNPPVSGTFYGGFVQEPLTAQDFLNVDKFRAQSDITIDGESFHLAGIGGSYQADQYLQVNFNNN